MDVGTGAGDAVRFTYLGVGGWIIERGDEQLLTAPLFSNPDLLTTGLAPIESDTLAVDRYMGRYDVRGAKGILVGHAHYDHLMDVPRVAERHAPAARILGNTTTAYTLAPWATLRPRVLDVGASVGHQRKVGGWIHLSSRLRVMPLRSRHAPHFDGYTLYQGVLEAPLEEKPRWATEWLDGNTVAYLIDFLAPDGRTVDFRVYYQDAVAPPPWGFAPEALIEDRPVDVAILVPATFDQVDWHPERFVDNLEPRWVLLGHWEDFFRSPERRTRSILLTDLGHFMGRLDGALPGAWWLPELWTEFRFPVR